MFVKLKYRQLWTNEMLLSFSFKQTLDGLAPLLRTTGASFTNMD